ncbi:MAG: PKD domain-containing protein, partial [Salibacteraceae bacterium]
MNQNNGQDGLMFNITAINAVTIDSVWSNFANGTIGTAEIYSRTGGIVGFQNNAAAWTLVGSANNVVSAGINNFTHIPINMNLAIPQGTVMGVYVTGTGTAGTPIMRYTNGAGTAGNFYNASADIQVSQGYGKDYPFGATFNPRIFNGRIFYSCCPTPPAPQGPISGDSTLCQGDTVSFSVPWDSIAVEYEWTVPSGDTIIDGEDDSLMTMVVGPNSTGGQICVALVDTCTSSPQICINYTINQPATPSSISGLSTICANNSATYTTPSIAGAISYTWTVPSGATINSGQGTTSANVTFGSASGKVCVLATDSCASSDSICYNVQVNAGPSPAVAGPDRITCSEIDVNLNAQSPAIGTGTWSFVSSPFSNYGTIDDTLSPTSAFNAMQAGTHVLRWTVTTPGCDAVYDDMEVEVLIAPTADFEFENGCEDTAIPFNDLSQGNGSSIGSYYWDMNQDLVFDHYGTTPSHTFNGSGTFPVQLIVNNLGCSDTIIKQVEVYASPEVNISSSDICQGPNSQIVNNTSIASGSIDSLIWNFGDGSGWQPSGAPNLNNSPSHLYEDPGNYTVNLKAISDEGCESTGNTSLKIFANPVASFDVDNACQYQTTAFNDQSQVIGSDVVIWNWNLGDGGVTSTSENPTHDYNANGIVPVTLSVESSDGCTDDTTVNVEIYPTPTSDFNFSNRVCDGEETTLEQVSTIDYGGFDRFEWTVIEDSFSFT